MLSCCSVYMRREMSRHYIVVCGMDMPTVHPKHVVLAELKIYSMMLMLTNHLACTPLSCTCVIIISPVFLY